MIPLLMFVVLAVAFLAALGRNGVPRAERMPVWSWGFSDLAANLVQGARVMGDLSTRHADLVDRARDQGR